MAQMKKFEPPKIIGSAEQIAYSFIFDTCKKFLRAFVPYSLVFTQAEEFIACMNHDDKTVFIDIDRVQKIIGKDIWVEHKYSTLKFIRGLIYHELSHALYTLPPSYIKKEAEKEGVNETILMKSVNAVDDAFIHRKFRKDYPFPEIDAALRRVESEIYQSPSTLDILEGDNIFFKLIVSTHRNLTDMLYDSVPQHIYDLYHSIYYVESIKERFRLTLELAKLFEQYVEDKDVALESLIDFSQGVGDFDSSCLNSKEDIMMSACSLLPMPLGYPRRIPDTERDYINTLSNKIMQQIRRARTYADEGAIYNEKRGRLDVQTVHRAFYTDRIFYKEDQPKQRLNVAMSVCTDISISTSGSDVNTPIGKISLLYYLSAVSVAFLYAVEHLRLPTNWYLFAADNYIAKKKNSKKEGLYADYMKITRQHNLFATDATKLENISYVLEFLPDKHHVVLCFTDGVIHDLSKLFTRLGRRKNKLLFILVGVNISLKVSLASEVTVLNYSTAEDLFADFAFDVVNLIDNYIRGG